MDAATIIKDWLAGFDSVIEREAIDPDAIRADSFLLGLFKLAFPPPGLLSKIVFRGSGACAYFEELASAHAPYYRHAKRVREKTDHTTGTTHSAWSLVLELNPSNDYRALLSERGLLRAAVQHDATLTRSSRKRTSSGGRSISHEVRTLEKILRGYEAELAMLDAHEREASIRGDHESAERYQADRNRTTELMERAKKALLA